MRRREKACWLALVLLALLLRVWDLGGRPPHHDEAVHGHFTHELLVQGSYRYDPTYHGPLLFFLTAGIFGLLGENLVTLRLYPVLTGVLLAGLPFFLRRRIGARAALWCGVLLAMSPSFLYYSRFARNDVPVSLFTAAAGVLFLLLRRGSWRVLPWAGAMLALHAISKETFYVLLPLLAVGAFGVVLRLRLDVAFRRAVAWVERYAAPAATAVLAFVVISLTAYTVFFIHPEDVAFPLKAFQYWHNQHTIQRVGGPWFYHLPRLALYEFLIIGAALVWAVRRRGRMHSLEVFLLWWGLASLGMYAYLGEKVPWLLVHQVLPFVPLAGMQLARTFSPRGRPWSRALATAGVVATLWSAAAVTYLYPATTTSSERAELLVFVQTTPEAGALAREGMALAASGENPTAAVAGEATWPLAWQWLGIPVYWDAPKAGMRPPLVVCDADKQEVVEANLGGGYRAERVPLRAWWVEEWGQASPWKVLRWFVTRTAWSPVGASDVVVLRRHVGEAADGV